MPAVGGNFCGNADPGDSNFVVYEERKEQMAVKTHAY